VIEIVKPHVTIESSFEGIMPLLERAGRTCYRSEDKIGDGTADGFIRGIMRRGHESVIEHATVSVRIVCDRSCSHQLVRHRLAAYSQESQRYCDYGKKGCQVICPPDIGLPPGTYDAFNFGGGVGWEIMSGRKRIKLSPVQFTWVRSVSLSYDDYISLRLAKIKPEDARSVLPNAVKTEVFSTFNLRVWRHIFKERALNPHAQWQIRGIFRDLLDKFAKELPAVFGDLPDHGDIDIKV
jgi:thymidylate synthase (FAD)